MRRYLLLVTLAACGGPLIDNSPMPAPARAPLADMAERPPEPPAPSTGNVVLEGTPEIPPRLGERLSQYVNARAASFQWLSDDGKRALITTRFADTEQLHWVSMPMGERKQLTFRDEPVSTASIAPGGDAVVYMSDSGGNERYQIFRLELGTGETTLLSDGKSRHGEYLWSHSGKLIAYTSNARNGKDMDLFLGDGKSPGRSLLEREGHWYPIDWSKNDDKLLVGQYVSINESRLYLVDVKTKAVTQVTPAEPVASYRAAVLAPDGQRVWLATDRDTDHVELYAAQLGKPDLEPLSRSIPWNVEELALSPDGKTLAFVTNEDGYGVLRLLDTATGRQSAAPGIPKGIVKGLRFAKAAPVLGFTLVGATTSGDAYGYDLRDKKLTRWTESEVGGLDPRRFVEPELVHYPTFDGRTIPAFYYRSPKKGPRPVVVWIHGGPESQARPSFSPLLQYLVLESGFSVLVPNVRGSDGYGKAYLLLDNGAKREDSVKDIGALLDWVKTQPELDAKRTAVLGSSYGGYMVLASLVHFGKRLRAGVDIVGISNFVTFLENTQAYRRDLRRAEYGDERKADMRKLLTRISPTENADKIESALFVAHGANDPRVPVGETEQIARAVRKNGHDVWYMLAKNEGHGFRKQENRDLFYRLTVLFLEKHLQ